jgi:hypothetical protein
VLGVFTQVAVKYKATEKAIPVLILDNANRLPGPILAQFQDFAKEASDKAIATLVFVSSGPSPNARYFDLVYSPSIVMLTKGHREKFLVS